MPDINTYIQQSRQQGISDEQIRQNLLGTGWQTDAVNQALGTISTVTSANSNSTRNILIITGVVMLLLVTGVIFAKKFITQKISNNYFSYRF